MIKPESITSIFKLVDACNQCSQLFRVAAVSGADSVFQDNANQIRHKLDQFGFELQTETRRIGGGDDFGPSRYEPIPDDADILTLRCEISLQLILDQYQQALNTNLPAHARAMVKRQYFEIQNAYENMVSLRRAA